MADNLIKISRRLTLPTMVLAWLFVFAVPVVLLQVSLDYLFELTLQANKQAATGTLISEMASFRLDLNATAYINRKLNGFFARDNIAPLSPDRLLEQIASETSLQPAGIITHTADTSEVNHYFAAQLAKQVQGLPRSLMRRYFVAVNQQYRYDYLDSAAKTAVDSMFRYADLQKSRKDSESFFRRHFSLITEMPLLPNQCCKSISAKLGGNVYFYYHPVFTFEAGKTYVTGGQLLIFRGADINWRDVWKNTASMTERGVKRGFVSQTTSALSSNKGSSEVFSRFSDDEAGFNLTSTVANVALVDTIQCGTMFPRRLDKVLSTLPLLRVSIPWKSLQHPLSGWIDIVGMLARLFALAGAVFLLRVFFFGLDFRLSISTKVLLGTAVMLLLPVMLLLAGFATWNQFHRVYGWYQAEDRQRLFFEEFQESFNNYLAKLQKHSLALAFAVEKKSKSSDADLEVLLKTGLAGSVASDIYLERKDGWKFHFQSLQHQRPALQEEESARRLTATAIIGAFNTGTGFDMAYTKDKQRNINVVDSAFVNELINRWGRLFKLSRMNVGNRLSTVFIHNDDKHSPYGLLSLKYYDEIIVRDFIANHFTASARFSDIKLGIYLAEKAGVGYNLLSLRDNAPLKDTSLLEKISLAEGSDSYSWRENGKELMQARWLSDFPLVVVAKATAFAGFNSDYLFLALLTIYSILLLLFVLLVFELIYLRPIREFIRVTEAVAAGSFTEQVNLVSTDEFGDLKVAFDGMINGLEQRRKLAHFVSQDVLAAIETDGDASGGVRVAATVVFMQIVSAAEHIESAAAAELFESLGRFISAGDRCARANGGVIDKVIENTLMMVFRAATAGESHCLQACRAALQLSATMHAAGFKVKAGIASGNVVSGRIGSRLGKLDYTVIGDTVNLAARLKAQADKTAKTGIIIAPGAIRSLKGLARVAFIERIELKGKSREYPLYELIELRLTSSPVSFNEESYDSF